MIRISIAEAGKSPQLLTYNSQAITLGRLPQHDLCLTGKGVSGTHCRILREGDFYFIEDLGSTNGTYVNRQRVQGRVPIGPTDDVVLAIYRLRVLADNESGISAKPMSGPMPPQIPLTGSNDGPYAATPGVRHHAPTAHVPAPTGGPPMGMPQSNPGANPGSGLLHMGGPPGPGAGPGSGLLRPGGPPGGPPSPGAGPGSGLLRPGGPMPGSGPSMPGAGPPMSGSSPSRPGQPMPGSSPSMPGSGPSIPGSSPSRPGGLLGGPAPTAGPGGRTTTAAAGTSPAEIAWGREWELIDKLATSWHASGKRSSELLRGDKLAHARKWLAQGRSKHPPPKALHKEFILAGATAKTLRTLGGMVVATMVLGGLGVGGWFYLKNRPPPDEPVNVGEEVVVADVGGPKKPVTTDKSDAKTSEKLVTEAEALLAEDPVLAALLATEAVTRLPSEALAIDAQAYAVLRNALRELPGRPLPGHQGAVERVALSPDGRWAITAGAGGDDVHLWDLDKPGVPNASALNGHPRGLTGMQTSADGRWLVTADSDGLAMRWNLQEADPASTGVRLEDHRARITALDMSADGHWLVTADEGGQVKVWDLEQPLPSASTLPKGHAGKVTGVATNADGTRVISSGEDMTARNWKVTAGRAKNPVIVTHEEVVVTAAGLAPDGSWAVTGGSDGVVRRWSPTTRIPTLKWELLPGHKGEVSLIETTADSSMAVSVAQDNDLWIWDLQAKVPSASSVRLAGHTGRISQLVIYSPPAGVPAGRHVPTTAFTASADGTARSWDLDQRKSGTFSRVFPGHKGGVRSVGVAGEGQWAITGGVDRTARVWDWQSLPLGESEGEMPRVGSASKIGRAHTGQVLSVAADAFGRRMITGGADGTARVWDMRHPTRLVALPFKDFHTDRVHAVAVSPTENWAASGDNSGDFVIWDTSSERPVGQALTGHTNEIGAVAFTPDGRRMISVSTDKTARVWTISGDVQNDVIVLQHDDELTQLSISGDGHWLLTGTVTAAYLWDLTGALAEPVAVLRGHEEDLKTVALDARGRWAATGSADRKILLYDLEASVSKPVAKLRKHEGAVQVLAFDPKGRWLASGSEDKTIRLWNLLDAHPDERSLELPGEAGISDLQWSDDGRWLVSAGNDGAIRLWEIREGEGKSRPPTFDGVVVLEGHIGVVPQIALVHDEGLLTRVVSVGYDGTARLWPLASTGLIELACTAVGRRLTEDEWTELMPGKYAPACK